MGGLVYRYEIIGGTLCSRKSNRVWKYIFLSEDVKHTGQEGIDEWQGRIRGIKLEIEKNRRVHEEWQMEWEKRQEEQERKNEEW